MFSSLGGIKKREPLFTFKKKSVIATTNELIYKPILFSTEQGTSRLGNAISLVIPTAIAPSLLPPTASRQSTSSTINGNTSLLNTLTERASVNNSSVGDQTAFSTAEKESLDTKSKPAVEKKKEMPEDHFDKEGINDESKDDDVFDFAQAIDEYASKELKLMVAADRPVPKKTTLSQKRSRAKKATSPSTSKAINNARQNKSSEAIVQSQPRSVSASLNEQGSVDGLKPPEFRTAKCQMRVTPIHETVRSSNYVPIVPSSVPPPPSLGTTGVSRDQIQPQPQPEPFDIFAFDINASTRSYYNNCSSSNSLSVPSIALNNNNNSYNSYNSTGNKLYSYQTETQTDPFRFTAYNATNIQPANINNHYYQTTDYPYYQQSSSSMNLMTQQSIPITNLLNDPPMPIMHSTNSFDQRNLSNPAPSLQYASGNVQYPLRMPTVKTTPIPTAATSTFYSAGMSLHTMSAISNNSPVIPLPPQPASTLSSSSSSSLSVSFSNTSHTNQTNNEPKKRKRNLVSQLKSATGEENKTKAAKKDFDCIFSDEDDSLVMEEAVSKDAQRQQQRRNSLLNVRDIISSSSTNKERSASPELSYKDKMELQLEAIMQSEFGEGKTKAVEESKEVIERRPRYRPMNKVNVRVTFQKPRNTNPATTNKDNTTTTTTTATN